MHFLVQSNGKKYSGSDPNRYEGSVRYQKVGF